VIERMNMNEITICYGLTENSPVMTQTLPDDDHAAAHGNRGTGHAG
jgi:acyl-CoA synthetase (AMP-forming)/AMP-acid ligase II